MSSGLGWWVLQHCSFCSGFLGLSGVFSGSIWISFSIGYPFLKKCGEFNWDYIDCSLLLVEMAVFTMSQLMSTGWSFCFHCPPQLHPLGLRALIVQLCHLPVRFIPRYFVFFEAVLNGSVSVHGLFLCMFVVCRIAVDFCKLILYPASLLKKFSGRILGSLICNKDSLSSFLSRTFVFL